MSQPPKSLRLLVSGTQGQVARALARRAQAAGVEVRLLGRPELDLADAAAAHAALLATHAERPFDALVNAAAYTAVDRAESEADLAFAVNEGGAAAVARAAADLGLPVIQLSTDYVFPGDATRAYREDDATGPVSVYGRSKLAGEAALAEACPDHAILRTAWVYAPQGANFVRTMLRLAGDRDVVRVVADQTGAPSAADDIADAVIAVARNLVTRPGDASLRGVFHLGLAPATTWADVARAVFAASRAQGGPSAEVEDIATSDYPTPARRPAFSLLDGGKLRERHGVAMPDWPERLRACVGEILTTRTTNEGLR
jgi:dTDP-4-dehydrorhamnose reductase